jgi:hypothetical protein
MNLASALHTPEEADNLIIRFGILGIMNTLER